MANPAGQYLSLKESVKISWWLDTVPGLIYNEYMASTIIYVNTHEVSCDGYDEVQQEATHPLVYYTLKEYKDDIKAACFYCGKMFIYKENS
jgi:uncharacterized Zn-finger protein